MLGPFNFLLGIGALLISGGSTVSQRAKSRNIQEAKRKRQAEHNFCPESKVQLLVKNCLSYDGYGIPLHKLSQALQGQTFSLPMQVEGLLVAEFFINMLTDYEFDWEDRSFVPNLSHWKSQHNMAYYLKDNYFEKIHTKFVFNPSKFLRDEDIFMNCLSSRMTFSAQWHEYMKEMTKYMYPYEVLGVELPVRLYTYAEIDEMEKKYGRYGERLPQELVEQYAKEYHELPIRWWG